MATLLQGSYPWTSSPLIANGPMLRIALPPLAVAVSRGGGLGFMAAGFDLSDLDQNLELAEQLLHDTNVPTIPHTQDVLPIGVGFLNWGADLEMALSAIKKHIPAAVWFFGPRQLSDLVPWSTGIRTTTNNKTKVWIQVGNVSEALQVAKTCHPDVIVVQGTDAGGHGLERGAGIVSLLPEVKDALERENIKNIPLIAAGGIADGRGAAAAMVLGAAGIVMGTRFLASKEAEIAKGYQQEILRAADGGTHTVRSKVYDTLRGFNDWPAAYGGRGVINQSYLDAERGHVDSNNMKMYAEALKQGDEGWGPDGRLTTYAGTAIGLVREVKHAGDIVQEVQKDALKILKNIGTSV
ncbi:MAG: hypothetical protein M1834_006250 [Cirrosporium novae-zelandiae]|nr:MAG: hypothetical protein M1834_006250 [Cirrosporium novae-zelandiae]